MVPLYTLFTLAVAGLKALLVARAGRVERKYATAALKADAAAKVLSGKRADPLAQAKAQYELGRLVEARDALEAKSLAWQARGERAGAALAKLRGWNGRLVPYLMGVVDVSLAAGGLHLLGLPHGLNADGLTGWVKSLMG